MGDEFYKKLHVCSRKALYLVLQRVPINETFSPPKKIGNREQLRAQIGKNQSIILRSLQVSVDYNETSQYGSGIEHTKLIQV